MATNDYVTTKDKNTFGGNVIPQKHLKTDQPAKLSASGDTMLSETSLPMSRHR